MTHVAPLRDSIFDNAAYVRGGAKIARAIVRLVSEHDFGNGRAEVFV